MDSLRDMFLYQLEGMYYIETELVDVLEELSRDATNERLDKAFAEHRNETQEHVDRLETVFERLDREPTARESPTFEGLREERRQFHEETTDPELRDLFDLQAGIKTERMEISGYQGLNVIAKRLEFGDDITDPLEDNLSSEKSTLRSLEALSQGSKMKAMVQQLLG